MESPKQSIQTTVTEVATSIVFKDIIAFNHLLHIHSSWSSFKAPAEDLGCGKLRDEGC